jgi:hypothetical protein
VPKDTACAQDAARRCRSSNRGSRGDVWRLGDPVAHASKNKTREPPERPAGLPLRAVPFGAVTESASTPGSATDCRAESLNESGRHKGQPPRGPERRMRKSSRWPKAWTEASESRQSPFSASAVVATSSR